MSREGGEGVPGGWGGSPGWVGKVSREGGEGVPGGWGGCPRTVGGVLGGWGGCPGRVGRVSREGGGGCPRTVGRVSWEGGEGVLGGWEGCPGRVGSSRGEEPVPGTRSVELPGGWGGCPGRVGRVSREDCEGLPRELGGEGVPRESGGCPRRVVLRIAYRYPQNNEETAAHVFNNTILSIFQGAETDWILYPHTNSCISSHDGDTEGM